jgi:hypothetical protein
MTEQELEALLQAATQKKTEYGQAYALAAVRPTETNLHSMIAARREMNQASTNYRRAFRASYWAEMEARDADSRCDRQMYNDLRHGG